MTTTTLMNYVNMIHEYGRDSELTKAFYEREAANNATFKRRADALHRLMDKVLSDHERERVKAEMRAERQKHQPETLFQSFWVPVSIAAFIICYIVTLLHLWGKL